MSIDRICHYCRNHYQAPNRITKYCSDECRKTRTNERARWQMRTFRMRCHKLTKNNIEQKKCQVCGFSETVDLHHEGLKGYWLCPNHHALITRGLKRIDDYKIEPSFTESLGNLKQILLNSHRTKKLIRFM
jgi:hypothetical protein